MSRMLDLIRASALPSHQMMSASKGALRLPAEEMVEILVYLAEHNKIFGEQARLTLAAWEEASAKTIAADPQTAKEVLDYWLSPKNLRPALFPVLIGNPSAPMTKVAELASSLKGEWVDVILASPRVRNSRQTLTDLSLNKELSGAQSARVRQLLNGEPVVEAPALPPQALTAAMPSVISTADSAGPPAVIAHESLAQPILPEPQQSEIQDAETEVAVVAFLSEHAHEISPSNLSEGSTRNCHQKLSPRLQPRLRLPVRRSPQLRRGRRFPRNWLIPRTSSAGVCCRRSPSSISRAAYSWR